MEGEDAPDRLAVANDDPVSGGTAGAPTGTVDTPAATGSTDPVPEGVHHEKIGMPTETRSANAIVKDMNDTYYELRDTRNALTTEVVESLSRDALHTKRSEFKTLEDVYEKLYGEVMGKDISDAIRNQLKSQKHTVDGIIETINQKFNSSKYAKADEQVAHLDELIQKVKNGKAGVTDDYLRVATAASLQFLRSDHMTQYNNYVAAFSAINVADLTPEQVSKITTEKLEVDAIASSIDQFFAEQIGKKEKADAKDVVDPKQTAAEQQLEVERKAHAKQLADINKQLEDIRNQSKEEKVATEQTIKSLEEKLESCTKTDDSCVDVLYQDKDGNDIPVGGTASEKGVVTLKLDSITLPYFDGDLTQWETFKDLFNTLVDNGPKLSDTLKFYQLRSHLKGVAFDTIRGYQLTGTNYQAAWSDLKKRFDRKDDLVDEYVSRFLGASAVTHKPTFANLRAIIDATNQMLRALPTLGVPVTSWDPFVNYIIVRKLDDESRLEWRQKKGIQMLPPTSDLLAWIEIKASELQPTHSDRMNRRVQGDKKRNQPKRIFQVNEKPGPSGKAQQAEERVNKCLICGKNHKLKNCYKFKQACAKARTDILKTLKLCFKCFLKHKFGACSEEDCSYCSGPHHVMLCYKKENDEQDVHQTQQAGTSANNEESLYTNRSQTLTPKNEKK